MTASIFFLEDQRPFSSPIPDFLLAIEHTSGHYFGPNACPGKLYTGGQGSYVAELDGGPVADASILLMGWVGYGETSSPRLLATRHWVVGQLGRHGLYDRYPEGFDGDSSREGTFSICSAWATDLMARQGDLKGAEHAFDRLAETANDVGLFSEEFDPEKGLSLGNFPQAFTHSGLITAALAIVAAEKKAREGT